MSVLENPPDDQPARADLDSIVQESQKAEEAAHRILEGGVGEEHAGEPMEVETPVLPTISREDPRGSEPEGASPSKRQRVGAEVSQLNLALRANPELLDRGVASSSGAEGSQDARACDVPVPEDVDDLEVTVGSGRDHWIVDHQRSLLVRVHEDEQVEEWRPRIEELPVYSSELEAVCQSVQCDRRGRKHSVEYEWKGKPQKPKGRHLKWTGCSVFKLKPGWKWKQAEENECMEVGSAKKGRKELVEKDTVKERKPGLEKAKLKEWNKLLQSGAIVVHRGKAAHQLKKSIPRKRVLKSRFVLTEAESGSSPATNDIKARWCIRGYLDPDLLELDTSAPTLSAEGFAVAMQLIASHGWNITIADVEGAFLRGDDLSPSRGRLFVDLPPGGIEGYDETCLVEAVKTVYGLADAPKAWWNCLNGKLCGLGLKVSEFDPCVYYYYHQGKVSGVVALHVDDLCMGGDKHFSEHVQDKLREMFPFKHWKVGKGEFLGKWLEQQSDGSIKISQEQYASELQSLVISQERRRQKED